VFKSAAHWVLKQPPEKLFLFLAALFSVIFLFIIPPMQGYDETDHFLRAYQVSQGQFSAQAIGQERSGGTLPANVVSMEQAFFHSYAQEINYKQPDTKYLHPYAQYLKVFTPSKKTTTVEFEGSAVYSPLNYLPQAIGIAVSRILHFPLLSYIYMGRLAKILVCLILGYLAIKIIPVGKWLVFAVMVLPTTITSMASFSPDPLVIGCFALLIAFFVKYLHSRKVISKRDAIYVGLLLVPLVLLKQSYFPIVLLFLFLPYRLFGSLKRYLVINAIYLFVSALIYTVWTLHVAHFSNILHYTQLPGEFVSPSQQIHYIEHSPLQYLRIFFDNLLSPAQTLNYAVELVSWVTWKYIKPTYIFVLLSYFTLFFGAIITYSESLVKTSVSKLKLAKYGPLFILAVIIFVIYTAFYISVSVTNSTLIGGVQGRYFVPLLLLPIPYLLLLKKPEIKIGVDTAKKLMFYTATLVLLVTAIDVFIVNFTWIRLA
jgi:uncharacterized membrane protein